MGKAEIEALLARIDVWLLIFGVIVVVGVAGESFFGIRHWWNSRKLQAIQDAEELEREGEIARLNKEAGDARRAAAEATERAANAEQRAAEANKKSEEERLARIRIEERLAARRISREQHRSIVVALSPYRGSTVEVTKLGDFEAGRFADDLALALSQSGWKIVTKFGGTVSPPCTVSAAQSMNHLAVPSAVL